MSDARGEDVAPTGLTGFRVDVARLFFTLPTSKRFLLAGGAALLAQHMTARPTQTSTSSPGHPVPWS